MTSPELEQLRTTIVETAREAGEVLRSYCGRDLKVNEASQHDLKLQADIDSQNLIERRLIEAYPHSSILGEEGGEGGTEMEWIVDPIDGTVNLAYGIPHFCVSIAGRVKGEVLAGVVYDPMKNECFDAVRGQGARLNGTLIQTSNRTQLKEAIITVGFAKYDGTVEKCLELYRFYANRVRKLRAMGSAALDLAYIAAGRFDAYIEQDISLWDIAAGELLVLEARGKVEKVTKPGRHKFHIKAWNGKIDFPES
ncbi:MAG: inositol monophosphatase family protein [Verrucomicrobiota bacterium]